MNFPHGETVTRQRAAVETDPYSTEEVEQDWAATYDLEIPGWAVDDSRSTSPLEVGRNAVVTDYVLYRQETADVLAGDRVVVRGDICNVVGRPATWRNPWTGWGGFVVQANRKDG